MRVAFLRSANRLSKPTNPGSWVVDQFLWLAGLEHEGAHPTTGRHGTEGGRGSSAAGSTKGGSTRAAAPAERCGGYLTPQVRPLVVEAARMRSFGLGQTCGAACS